ncbi:hypothetical protein OUZ56_016818 [Daphnia magna]|uniref:Uncharacterized protein n=1 Tax=Daphnia magna TaxID=35525 RepID=A0ABR0ARN4_9CRUS|nr:hypothetical protein OUZ56_016818 [Daphnia magna]
MEMNVPKKKDPAPQVETVRFCFGGICHRQENNLVKRDRKSDCLAGHSPRSGFEPTRHLSLRLEHSKMAAYTTTLPKLLFHLKDKDICEYTENIMLRSASDIEHDCTWTRSPLRKGGGAVLIALPGGGCDEAGLPSAGTLSSLQMSPMPLPASWPMTSSMGLVAATIGRSSRRLRHKTLPLANLTR